VKIISISEAKTADLVKFYNDFCERIGATPVKKFADRATAEKRVAEFVAKLGAQDNDFADLAEGFVPFPEGHEGEAKFGYAGEVYDTQEERDAAESNAEAAKAQRSATAFSTLVATVQEAQKRSEENGGQPVVRPASTGSKASNSDGVAASWVDAEVRAARLKRDGVKVEDETGGLIGLYRSTREAFRANRLPDNKHIRFRLKLKEAHRDKGESATFEHNGKKYVFTIVQVSDDEVPAAE
jgi:hypothetical protein